MKIAELVKNTQGEIKVLDGITGAWWDGPPEAPENALFIPLEDLGYTMRFGIFRKSLAPERKNELED